MPSRQTWKSSPTTSPNINTTGYKRARAEFSDLLYQVDRTQGVPNRSNASLVPEGVSIGLGVKTTAVRNVHTQGELTSTGTVSTWRSPAGAGSRSRVLTAARSTAAPAPSTPTPPASW